MITGKVTFKPGPVYSLKTGPVALEALRNGGEHILKESRDLVPIEEGTLERSGRVTDDGVGRVAISYDTPYAVRQHEDLTLRHAAGRSAKYLERPLMAARDTVRQMVATAVRRALGG